MKPPSLPNGATLRRIGIVLRNREDGDLPYLRALDAAIRGGMLMGVAWSEVERTRFLDTQFTLQHRHFLTCYGAADFLVIQQRAQPIGRLYIDRSRSVWRIVDIAIEPSRQRHGLGRALLQWIQRAARRTGADGIDLHVAHDNPGAARLYAALGFVDAISAFATHRRMTWPANRPASRPAM